MILRLTNSLAATTARIQAVHTLRPAPLTPDGATLTSALDAIGSMLPNTTPKPNLPSPPPSSEAPATTIPPAEDPLLHYLTSILQHHGHRAKAARISSRTLLYLHTFTRSPPLPILREAVLAVSPAVRSMIHRQGAKNVVKPVALGEKQRTRFALQWILTASKKRSGQTVEERLARELIAVLQGTSEALKKKEEAHRFAMVNRGNAQWRV